MRYYFLITGVLFVLYYLILVWHSRKLRSTFAVFWLFTGGAHLIIGCAPFPAYMYIFLTAVCCAGWICFISVEIRIFSAMFSGCDRKVDCIIVLGAQVKGKKITDSLKRRLDRAAGYLQEYPDTRVIVSGGRGPGEEISEADAMAEDTFIDDRNNFRWQDVLSTGLRVFIAGIDGATGVAQVSGGGGTSNDMPWRDKDEDFLDWARRAMRYAHAKHYPGNRFKRSLSK